MEKFIKNTLIFTLLFLSGCVSFIQTVGIKLINHHTDWPESLIHRNVPYRPDDSQLAKHKLDLFLPSDTNFPTMVFIHGGGWTTGDKTLNIGGEDVYGNIGRFYASRGIAVAVINYRLIKETDKPHPHTITLDDQIDDAAAATAWVYHNINKFGGDPNRLFLSGHSAGAQIASHVALRPDTLKKYHTPQSVIRGVICVSGAGLDMTDPQTDAYTKDKNYYPTRLADKNGKLDWKIRNSPAHYIHAKAPPFLILYASGEYQALQRQAQLFHDLLKQKKVATQLITIEGENHERMVLVMSHPQKEAASAITNMILND